MTKENNKEKEPKLITDWTPVSISLVSQCPYCGSENWDKPVKKPNGEICKHPTRFGVRGSAK